MQSVLAPLSVPASMGEVFSATPQVEQGDGSFAETFGEIVPDADTASQPDDTTTADYSGPMVWNGLLPTAPKFALAIGAGNDEVAALQTAETSVDTAKGIVDRWAVGSETAPVALQQALISNPSPISQPPGEPPLDDTGNVGERTPAVGIAAALSPSGAVPDIANAGPAVATDTALTNPGSVTPPSPGAAIAPSILPTETANRGTTVLSPEATRSGKPATPSNRFAPAGDERNDQVNPRQTSVPEVEIAGPVTVKVNPEGAKGAIRNDDARPDPGTEEHGRLGSEGQANAALRPIQAQSGLLKAFSGPAPLDQSSSVPAGQSVGPQLPDASVDPAVATQAPVVPMDGIAAPNIPATSFWERFFSGPTAPTRLESGAAVGEPPKEISTSSEPAEVPEKSERSGDPVLAAPALDKESIGTPSTTDASPNSSNPGAAPSSTASPEIQSEAFNGSVSGWAFSGLDGNEGLHSRWPLFIDPLVATTQTSTGPLSGTNGIQSLPVQQVASQLAAVLVRSASSVTELALAPEELGRVKLRMEQDTANPDRMVIMISVDRPETLDLFRRHASELADAIRSAGYSGADIGFDQSGGEGASGQRREASSLAPALPFDDLDQTQTTPMLSVGASLDLRL